MNHLKSRDQVRPEMGNPSSTCPLPLAVVHGRPCRTAPDLEVGRGRRLMPLSALPEVHEHGGP